MDDNYDELNLGWFEVCLNVKNLGESLDFYKRLGFRAAAEFPDEGYAVLTNGDARIALYQGHIERNIFNFRGAPVFEIAVELKRRGFEFSKPARTETDGSDSAEIIDPDGNVIYFNTFPGEKKLQ